MSFYHASRRDPPEIRDKLASLQSQKAIVKDLAKRLKDARIEYDRLVTEINAYRASVAPIQKCPEEVVVMIFHAYAKRNPALWSYINIRFGEAGSVRGWDVKGQAASITQMIRTCVKYSASVPLHITLDYRQLEPTESRLHEYLVHCLQEINPDQAGNYISDCLGTGDINLTLFATSTSGCHPDRAIEPLSELRGEGGIQMRRWASLDLILPEEDLDLRENMDSLIWRALSGSTPNLVKFSVSGGSNLSLEGLQGKEDGFLDLSSLEVLELNGFVSDLDFLPLKFDLVKCLTLKIDPAELPLSGFTHLERLRLYCYDSEANSSSTMNFPCLQNLFLAGCMNRLITWNVPVLQLLELGDYHVRIIGDVLPNVQALHVVLGDSVAFPMDRDIRNYLHKILSKYNTMQELTIPARLRSQWERLLDDLAEKHELPKGLPKVVFSGANDGDHSDSSDD